MQYFHGKDPRVKASSLYLPRMIVLQLHLKAVKKNECFHWSLNSIQSVCSLTVDMPIHQSPAPKEALGIGAKRGVGGGMGINWAHSAEPQRKGWPDFRRASHWEDSLSALGHHHFQLSPVPHMSVALLMSSSTKLFRTSPGPEGSPSKASAFLNLAHSG